jgi:hypothetical protein
MQAGKKVLAPVFETAQCTAVVQGVAPRGLQWVRVDDGALRFVEFTFVDVEVAHVSVLRRREARGAAKCLDRKSPT